MVAVSIVWTGFVWYCIVTRIVDLVTLAIYRTDMARLKRRRREIEAETREIERRTIATTLRTAELKAQIAEGRR